MRLCATVRLYRGHTRPTAPPSTLNRFMIDMDRHYDPKTHFFRSNRHFETRAPSRFRNSFATHIPVRLCPEKLKSTFNYCDMPSQI